MSTSKNDIWVKSNLSFREKEAWWGDESIWQNFWQWVQQQPWLKDIKYMAYTLGESPKPIDWQHLNTRSYQEGDLIFLYDHPKENKIQRKLEIAVRPNQLNILSELRTANTDGFSEDDLNTIIRSIKDLAKLRLNSASLESASIEAVPPFDFPKPRPVFFMPFRTSAFIDIISKADLDYLVQNTHWSEQGLDPDFFQTIARTALPKGIKREIGEATITIRWVSNTASEKVLKNRMAQRLAWWARISNWPLDDAWNQAGDKALHFPNLVAHPEVTLYHPQLQAGLLAIVPAEDLSMQEKDVLRIQQIIQKQEPDSDHFIKNLFLILPDQKSAIALESQAKSLGIKRVFYAGDEGVYWSIDPAGNYLSPQQQEELLGL